jgi:hypothetical protein
MKRRLIYDRIPDFQQYHVHLSITYIFYWVLSIPSLGYCQWFGNRINLHGTYR